MRLSATRMLLLGGATFFGAATVDAQITSERARTDAGREVVLRSDGTWTFAVQPPQVLPPASPGRQASPPPPVQPAPQALPQPQPQRPSVPPLFPNAQPQLPQAVTPPQPARPQPTLTPAAPVPQAQPTPAPPRPTAARLVQRPADATAQHTTRRGNFRFWYNPAKWKPAPENPDGRIQFQLTGNEAYIVLIPEGTPLPVAQLKTVAIENARQSGTDARIVSEELRTIAGREVLQMQINVTIDAIPIAFIGYYFGDPRGSVQLVGFTAQSDLPRYRAALLEGLDGLDLNR